MKKRTLWVSEDNRVSRQLSSGQKWQDQVCTVHSGPEYLSVQVMLMLMTSHLVGDSKDRTKSPKD